MHKITCPCGKDVFFTAQSKVGRKKYCSKVCHYKYHGRRSGLKYVLKKENPTTFKKGFTPWNKGLDLGEKCKSWKGDNVSKDSLHDWITVKLGEANKCEICGTTKSKRFDWSNKYHTYKRTLTDWQRLCVKCHSRYDYEKFGTRKCFYEKN
jgi:hypothetical protein